MNTSSTISCHNLISLQTEWMPFLLRINKACCVCRLTPTTTLTASHLVSRRFINKTEIKILPECCANQQFLASHFDTTARLFFACLSF